MRLPIIDQVSPRSAVAGETVTIRGRFIDAAVTLMVGGQSVPVTSVEIGPIDVVTYVQPVGSGCEETLVVTNSDGTSDSAGINLTPVSTSHTATASSMAGVFLLVLGPVETLHGTMVTVAGVPVTTFPVGNGLLCAVPPGPAGPANLVITNAIGCSLTRPFTYL